MTFFAETRRYKMACNMLTFYPICTSLLEHIQIIIKKNNYAAEEYIAVDMRRRSQFEPQCTALIRLTN